MVPPLVRAPLRVLFEGDCYKENSKVVIAKKQLDWDYGRTPETAYRSDKRGTNSCGRWRGLLHGKADERSFWCE